MQNYINGKFLQQDQIQKNTAHIAIEWQVWKHCHLIFIQKVEFLLQHNKINIIMTSTNLKRTYLAWPKCFHSPMKHIIIYHSFFCPLILGGGAPAGSFLWLVSPPPPRSPFRLVKSIEGTELLRFVFQLLLHALVSVIFKASKCSVCQIWLYIYIYHLCFQNGLQHFPNVTFSNCMLYVNSMLLMFAFFN